MLHWVPAALPMQTSADITKRIICPSDCVLLVCIPTEEATYFEALRSPENRDLIPIVCPMWAKYRWDVVSSAEKTVPAIRKTKTVVIERATFAGAATLERRATHLKSDS